MFKIPLLLTAAILVGTFILAGPQTAAIVAILAILEISLSFDNAVVNAKILGRMTPYWQKIFLTVGIAIAVFGMRLIFPLAVVAIAAVMSPFQVLHLAINNPLEYAHQLHLAHPAIAAFGGMFLLMIFLDFLLEEREVTWLGPIERTMARIGKIESLPIILALVWLIVTSHWFGNGHAGVVTVAGILGLITYLATNSLAALFEEGDTVKTVATGGFFTFLYLEVLDASFSFDGVTGAFAISYQIFVIALGLGIGALFIRSLTVYLVRKGTLSDYIYLEHGAHYAIGALAILLFVGITHEVPELITGLIGVGFIGAAFGHSMLKLRG